MVECVVKETNLSKDVWFIDITGTTFTFCITESFYCKEFQLQVLKRITLCKSIKVSMTLVMMMTVIYTTVWVSVIYHAVLLPFKTSKNV